MGNKYIFICSHGVYIVPIWEKINKVKSYFEKKIVCSFVEKDDWKKKKKNKETKLWSLNV
jgi:hypothetical protein